MSTKNLSILLLAKFVISVGDPDPNVFGPSGSVSHKYGSGTGSFHHQAKKVRKTLISTVTSLWLFILKNDVNISVFRIRIRIRMLLGLPDPHPDPLVRDTDPKIRIRSKMPRVPNTVTYNWDFRFKKSKMLSFYLWRWIHITCDVQRTEAVQDADAGRLQPAQQQQGQAQERGEDHGGDRRQGLHPGGGARQPGTGTSLA